MKERKVSLVYGTALLTAAGLVSQLIAFFYRIALARLAGAEVLGLYQLILPVYAVLTAGTAAGLNVAVSTLTSGYGALGNRAAVRQTLRLCLRVLAVLSGAAAAFMILFCDQVSARVLGDSRTELALLLLLPCVLLTGVENLHKNVFYGLGIVRAPALLEVGEQLIRTGAALLLLLLFLPLSTERTLGLVVTGMLCAEVFSSGAMVLLYRSERRGAEWRRGRGEPEEALGRKVAGIALPVGVTAVIGNLLASANAVLVPAKLCQAGATQTQAIARFGVLCGMTIPMLCLPLSFLGAMGLLLVPRLAGEHARRARGEMQREIDRALRAVSLLILPALALLAVFGGEVSDALYGQAGETEYLAPLAVGVAAAAYEMVLGGILNGIGGQRPAARNGIISAAVQLGLTAWLMSLPGAGLGGYVAAFVLASFLGAGLNCASMARCAGVKVRLYPWAAAPALAAVLMGLCCNLLFELLKDGGIAAAPAAGMSLALGGMLYLAALQAQGMLPHLQR